MAFWSDASMKSNDPKRQYRFKVQVGKSGKVEQFVVKKTDKPSFAVSEAEHKFLNHTYYYPGRVTWNVINITLVDQGGPKDTSNALSQMVADAGYDPGNALNWRTMSKKTAVGQLGHVIIAQIDADGKTIEQWTLKNAWIQDLKYGDLAYDGDDLTEVSMAIRYDWAQLHTPAGGDIWSTATASIAK